MSKPAVHSFLGNAVSTAPFSPPHGVPWCFSPFNSVSLNPPSPLCFPFKPMGNVLMETSLPGLLTVCLTLGLLDCYWSGTLLFSSWCAVLLKYILIDGGLKPQSNQSENARSPKNSQLRCSVNLRITWYLARWAAKMWTSLRNERRELGKSQSHYFLTFTSFQICMTFFLLWDTNGEFPKNSLATLLNIIKENGD